MAFEQRTEPYFTARLRQVPPVTAAGYEGFYKAMSTCRGFFREERTNRSGTAGLIARLLAKNKRAGFFVL